MSAAPAPGPTPSEEQDLDAVLDHINALADQIIETANARAIKTGRVPKPTQALSQERYKKTQAAFQVLSEEDAPSLLESRDDTADAPENTAEKPATNGKAKRKSSRTPWPWKRAATGGS